MTTNPYSKSVNKNSLGIFKVALNCFHRRGIEMAQHSERGEEHKVANQQASIMYKKVRAKAVP